MVSKTATLNVNVDAKTKKQATNILKDLGLNMTTAVNVFLAQIVKRNGIPFEITNPTPSQDLLESLQELDDAYSGKTELKGYHNVDEFVKDMLK